MKAIQATNISKVFQFKIHKGLKGFLQPQTKDIVAVDNISLSVEAGESVAFIGPNGAGKSTTIKMLTGILQPTNGEILVLGKRPLQERRELAMQIGTVFGQRSQLVFNLPLTDSFELTASMYQVPKIESAKRIKTLVQQFGLDEFISQPVRKLSLGQRMRAEVANALIHNPKIIFLDEPTIGLDIVAKRALREVIKDVNRTQGTTVFLTSHDVGDIEEICNRTMIINHGTVVLDAQTDQLKKDYLKTKTVAVVPAGDLPRQVEVAGVKAKPEAGRLIFAVDTARIELKTFIPKLFEQMEVADITIEDMPLEDIIHELYTKAAPEVDYDD
ncbi:MAG TPA: ATP-binding cassette domain-containing protein [Patescibacteria group bacterium]|jgi:ABC-2 type transport system ATP-binding protein|nr:ATP-binding cassette domain-containing protein [Patescibacteria group bacterium]